MYKRIQKRKCDPKKLAQIYDGIRTLILGFKSHPVTIAKSPH